MTDNEMMDYYVWSRHLYSHSRTCTHSSLCRIPSILVASHATSLIMPVFMRFQLLWLDSSICQMFPAIMEILIHYISSVFMEILVLCISSSWIFSSIIYCTWQWPHMSQFVYHAYSWPLYSYVSRTAVCICSHMQRYLYYTVGWLVLPPGSSSLHF